MMRDHSKSVAETMDDIKAAIEVLLADGKAAPTRVADALIGWRDHRISWDKSLALPANWRAFWRRSRRDQLLATIARRHYGGVIGRPTASAIAAEAASYAGNGWKRDRKMRKRPSGLRGDLYDLLAFGQAPGPDRIRQILEAQEQLANPPPVAISRHGSE